jgi:hypothetical protein
VVEITGPTLKIAPPWANPELPPLPPGNCSQ